MLRINQRDMSLSDADRFDSVQFDSIGFDLPSTDSHALLRRYISTGGQDKKRIGATMKQTFRNSIQTLNVILSLPILLT